VFAEEFHNGVNNIKKISFISDRDKVMARVYKEVFSTHHSLDCAVHIQQNVQQLYSRKASQLIMQLAKTYSKQNENTILDRIKDQSDNAYNYIVNIPCQNWRSASWLEEEFQYILPP
jgi:CO dehydrogenase/acetyl-CoA synthase beta subunit